MTKTHKNPGCGKCEHFRQGLSDGDGFACITGEMTDNWMKGPASVVLVINPAIRNKELTCPNFKQKGGSNG